MSSTRRPTPSTPKHPSHELAKPSQKTGRSGKFENGVGEVGTLGLRPEPPRDPDRPRPTVASPRKGTRVARRRRLHAVASTQHGLFTREQAAAVGHDRRTRYHHLEYGNWRATEAPGVYRLSGWAPDPAERLRAWLLWAGPRASITSWTALALHNLTVAGPRSRVEIVVPAPLDRPSRRRHARLQAQLVSLDAAAPTVSRGPGATLPSPTLVGPPAVLHARSTGSPLVIDGLRVSSPTEALCVAVRGADGRGRHPVALALIEALLDLGAVDQNDLAATAITMGCVPVTELIFDRRTRALAG